MRFLQFNISYYETRRGENLRYFRQHKEETHIHTYFFFKKRNLISSFKKKRQNKKKGKGEEECDWVLERESLKIVVESDPVHQFPVYISTKTR